MLLLKGGYLAAFSFYVGLPHEKKTQ